VAAAPPTPPRGPPRLGSIHHVRGRDPTPSPGASSGQAGSGAECIMRDVPKAHRRRQARRWSLPRDPHDLRLAITVRSTHPVRPGDRLPCPPAPKAVAVMLALGYGGGLAPSPELPGRATGAKIWSTNLLFSGAPRDHAAHPRSRGVPARGCHPTACHRGRARVRTRSGRMRTRHYLLRSIHGSASSHARPTTTPLSAARNRCPAAAPSQCSRPSPGQRLRW